MELDGALGDREPQPRSAAVGVARFFHAKERIEDARQGILRHARPVVAHADEGVMPVLLEGNARWWISAASSGLRCEPRSPWRAPQQFAVAQHFAADSALHFQAAAAESRLRRRSREQLRRGFPRARTVSAPCNAGSPSTIVISTMSDTSEAMRSISRSMRSSAAFVSADVRASFTANFSRASGSATRAKCRRAGVARLRSGVPAARPSG